MSDDPTADRVRALSAYVEQFVPDDYIDENGHMNIGHYFQLGAWSAWARLRELGMDEEYIPTRAMSFFTVEHRIRYLSELRLGEPFSVRSTVVERTERAGRAISFVLDERSDRLACVMEVVYVHVDMQTRRAAPIPEDLAGAMDAEIAAHPWAVAAATGLSLRR